MFGKDSSNSSNFNDEENSKKDDILFKMAQKRRENELKKESESHDVYNDGGYYEESTYDNQSFNNDVNNSYYNEQNYEAQNTTPSNFGGASYSEQSPLDYLLSDDDEYNGAMFNDSTSNSTLEGKMNENINELKRLYPMGGIKSSRFITTEILLEAPEDYFSKFDEIVKELVSNVQLKIIDLGASSIIGEAQNDPTNEEKQDLAYRRVYTIALDYMDKQSRYLGLDRSIIINLACNEIVGFSRLDPLWRDRTIDEIICNGPHDVQVEISGMLYKVPSCKFHDIRHLLDFITRLYGAINKVVAPTTPLVKGRLHDKSRMFVTHPTVSPDGPNFNIRRHKEDYIGPQRLVEWGSANQELLEDLGNWIYRGCSFMISGATSTGKTTLLGALSTFIRPDSRIISLEDNLEMKLAPHKLMSAPMECVEAAPDRKNDHGVTMRDLVKASLQMRPDGIIIGEVTDGSAYDLTQALNTGHWGASTIHANNEYDAIYRIASLVAQGGLMGGKDALPLIAAAFNFIIQVDHFPEDGTRKIVSISEVAAFPERNQHGELILPTKKIWEFRRDGIEKGKVMGDWVKINEISDITKNRLRLDLSNKHEWNELLELTK